MFVILWEFEVKPDCKERFETVYGPEGNWAVFFRRDPEYRGTRLLRDMAAERSYVTLDFWSGREAYEAFRRRHRAEFEALDAECALLTTAETRWACSRALFSFIRPQSPRPPRARVEQEMMNVTAGEMRPF